MGSSHKLIQLLTVLPLLAACSASITGPNGEPLANKNSAFQDLVEGPSLDGHWISECAPTATGQFVRLTMKIESRNVFREQDMYADANCSGSPVDFMKADGQFRFAEKLANDAYKVEYSLASGDRFFENVRLSDGELLTTFKSSGSAMEPTIVLKRKAGTSENGAQVINHYDAAVSSGCFAAANWKSARYAACSTQGGYSYYEVQGTDGDLTNLKMTHVSKTGAKITFENPSITPLGSGVYKILLRTQSDDTLRFDELKKSPGVRPSIGYAVLNGNSGRCVPLMVADRNSCLDVHRRSSTNSDNIYVSDFKFPAGTKLDVGTCKLRALAAGTYSPAGKFEVESENCMIKGKNYSRGKEVSFDLTDEDNFPLLVKPTL